MTAADTRRGRWSSLARFAVLPGLARLLLLTQLAFNIGFYLVVPFLATHLADDLAMAGWAIGIVLGVRTFSQQGMFALGGALADRFGVRPTVLAGCSVRIAGFLVLAAAGDFPTVLIGTVLIGFAAALFSPAVESALAVQGAELEERGVITRTELFGLFAVCGEVGAVTGPLLGAALLSVDFGLTCSVAAAVFAVILAAHARYLPRGPHAEQRPLLAGWADIARNRTFLVFAAGYSAYLLSYNQLYLALPVELGRSGADWALGWMFALASVVVVFGQLPLAAWARTRLGAHRALPLGFGLLSLAFAAVAVLSPWTLPDGLSLVPAGLFVVLLTCGQMLAVPVAWRCWSAAVPRAVCSTWPRGRGRRRRCRGRCWRCCPLWVVSRCWHSPSGTGMKVVLINLGASAPEEVRTRMSSPQGLTRVVALLAGALVLSGCFASAPGGDADDRLGVAMSFQPVANLSPYSDDALLLTKLGTAETLTVLDRDGIPRPALAESWEQTDPRTLRLNLRAGVTFHDGTPLTAERAAASLNHVTTATTPPRALKGVRLTAKATGERTLEITTAEPDPILPQRLTAPQLAILAPSAYADPSSPNPVRAGTGPYVLDSVQGTSGATLNANPGYWGGAPKTSGIDARFLADGASRANALRAGEVDVVDTVPVSQLPAISGNEVLDVPLPRLVGAHLNTRSAVFADPAMRAAARQAIDPAGIAGGVYAGQADPARGLFGPASPWAGEAPQPSTAPGEPRGKIRIATYDERPELPEIASVVAENLRAAGFEVSDVVVQEYSTMESDLLSGAYDVVIGARNYSVDTGDPISYLSSDWTCEGGYNLSRLCDPAIDAAVGAALAAPVEERERAAVRIAGQVLGTDAIVPIAHERTRIGLAPGVRGVAEDGFDHGLITAETTRGA